MKKIITIVAVAFATVLSANAQEFKVGARAGLNLSTFNNPEETTVASTIKTNTGFRTGYHIGAFIEYGFNEQIFVEGGIAYSQQGASLKSTETTILGVTNKIDLDKTSVIVEQLNVPIWLKYDLNGFRPKVGVNLGFVSKAKSKVDTTTTDIELDKKFDAAVGIGAEYNLDMGLFFDANFNLGFTSIGAKGSNYKSRVIQIGVGYKF